MSDAKAAARRMALAARKAAHAGAGPEDARVLERVLADHAGSVLAGYLPIRTEIDPRRAMAAHSAAGPVGVPVIEGSRRPLSFRRWTPDTVLTDGPFGVQIPTEGEMIVPTVLIVPLLAFDRGGGRLGYGGGFYDRTLAQLRRAGPVLAIGYAFAAQEVDQVPLDDTDERLDLIVTDTGVIRRATG